MSADTAAFVLLLAMVPPANLFPMLYGLGAPWWRTSIGRALMLKATGLAALVDLSLLYRMLGDDYPGRDVVRLTVFALIVAGLWTQLAVLVRTQYLGRDRE